MLRNFFFAKLYDRVASLIAQLMLPNFFLQNYMMMAETEKNNHKTWIVFAYILYTTQSTILYVYHNMIHC